MTLTLDYFRARGIIHPELCFVTSVAIGFPVSIFWVAGFAVGSDKPDQYQVMSLDPRDEEGDWDQFWGWYVDAKEQMHDTPELAAAAFVESWLEWRTMKG